MRAWSRVNSVVLGLFLLLAFYPILLVLAAGVDSISLVSPVNGTLSNLDNESINFIFNWTGDNATAVCTLYMKNSTGELVDVGQNDTTLNETNTTLQSNKTIEEGVRLWYINCTNETETMVSFNWTLNIDRTEPLVTINNPTNNTINSDLFKFTYNDVNCTIYSVDGGTNVTNCSIDNLQWNGTLSSLSDGQHNITVWANDSYGNLNSSTRYWYRDMSGPAITIQVPTNTSYSSNDTWFNVTLNETGDACLVNYGYGNKTMTNSMIAQVT
jgi:hypothetical protein